MPTPKISLFERAIAGLAPRYALERAIARDKLTLFGYDAAHPGTLRGNSGGMGKNAGSETSKMAMDRLALMWDARDLERNMPVIRCVLDRTSQYVCGTVQYQAQTGDEQVDSVYESYWQNWCNNVADITGRHNFRMLVELASFPCAFSAAENILGRIGLNAGERVLITGASGGVGSAAVQLAKRRGAEVVAMVGGDKAEAVRALGADLVVPRDVDLQAQFGADHFDAAVDIVGGAGFGAILNALKRGGRYGVAGAISGPLVELDLRTLYLKDLRLFGCTVLDPEVFPNLVGYIERAEIRPCIAATYPLAEIVQAQEAFLTKRHVGKIVLTL